MKIDPSDLSLKTNAITIRAQISICTLLLSVGLKFELVLFQSNSNLDIHFTVGNRIRIRINIFSRVKDEWIEVK
jgi:hypothetical protein